MVEPKLDEPAPKEDKKPKAAAQKPQPTTPAPIDPYLVFIDSSQIVVPDDLAAYRKGDEGMITVFVDVKAEAPSTARSISATRFSTRWRKRGRSQSI